MFHSVPLGIMSPLCYKEAPSKLLENEGPYGEKLRPHDGVWENFSGKPTRASAEL